MDTLALTDTIGTPRKEPMTPKWLETFVEKK